MLNDDAKKNRLLALEQELLRKRAALANQAQASTNPSDRGVNVFYDGSLFALEHELLERKVQANPPKRQRRPVKYEVFDTNEPIQLHYNPNSYLSSAIAQNFNSQPQAIAYNIESEEHKHSLITQSHLETTQPNQHPAKQEKPQTLEEALKTIPLSDVEQLVDVIRHLLAASNLPSSADAPSTTSATSHASFNQMGKDMTYATAFDLGTVELEQRFDTFNQALAQAEQAKQSEALVLEQRFDEFDRALEQREKISPPVEEQQPTEDMRPASSTKIVLRSAEGSSTLRSLHQQDGALLPIQQQSSFKPSRSPHNLQQTPWFWQKLAEVFFQTGLEIFFLTQWFVNFLNQTQILCTQDKKSLVSTDPSSELEVQPLTLTLPPSTEDENYLDIQLHKLLSDLKDDAF